MRSSTTIRGCPDRRAVPAGVAVALLASFLIAFSSLPARADKVEDEFTFALGLIDLGFPDFAETRLAFLERDYPDKKARINFVRAKVLISRRKLPDAEAIVKTMPTDSPKAQAIRLELAKAYFGKGETEKAREIYEQITKQYEKAPPSDPDLLKSLQESSYQFGQMFESVGDIWGAIKAYEWAMKSGLEPEAKRRLTIEVAELFLKASEEAPPEAKKKHLAHVRKLCQDVQWGGYDLWFGRSISIMAYADLLEGKRGEAIKLLKGYMKDLKEIDKLLKEANVPRSLSPMAGARYLLGKLYKEDAETALKGGDVAKAKKNYGQALGELENVFRKYGDSDWGPDAGVLSSEIKDVIKEQGWSARVDATKAPKTSGASGAVFKGAQNLLRQKKFAQAVEEYLSVLNRYPDIEAAAGAVGDLIMGYANQGDVLHAKTVGFYLAERFSGQDKAALGLLRAGKYYLDQNQPELFFQFYDWYMDFFPKHVNAPKIVWTLASLAAKEKDSERELKYLDRIVNNYADSVYYVKALRKSAFDHYNAGNYEAAIPSLEKYVEAEQPGYDKALGQFCIADSLNNLGENSKAYKEYTKLVGWIAKKENNPYRGTLKEKEVLDLLEKSAFFRGLMLARLKIAPDKVAAIRQKAIEAYDAFMKSFPKSDLLSKALRAKGAVLLELGQFEQATSTFEELATRFPDTDEGQNAIYFLISSAIEVKQFDQARKSFQDMVAKAGAYTPDQFVRIGELMLENKFYPEAGQAYEQVRGKTEERSLLERALFGLGKSMAEQERYEESAKFLEELMTKYADSAYFYEAKFLMGETYRKTGRFQEAIDALGDVFRYGKEPRLINAASMELALTQREKGDLESALASCMRIALLADASDPEIAPILEKAILLGVEVARDMARWQDGLDLIDQYLKALPDGAKVADIRTLRREFKRKAATAAIEAPLGTGAGETP